jgi:hypothetical protein
VFVYPSNATFLSTFYRECVQFSVFFNVFCTFNCTFFPFHKINRNYSCVPSPPISYFFVSTYSNTEWNIPITAQPDFAFPLLLVTLIIYECGQFTIFLYFIYKFLAQSFTIFIFYCTKFKFLQF